MQYELWERQKFFYTFEIEFQLFKNIGKLKKNSIKLKKPQSY